MKKRNSLIAILSSLFAIIILPLISAQYGGYGAFSNLNLGEGVRQIINQIILFGAPVFELILGDYAGSEFFFTKILLMVLLIVIIDMILLRVQLFEGNPRIAGIVAIIVSVMAVRFISENELITAILLPYGTLGIALTTILPFLIFFYFIYSSGMHGLGRKLSWIFFALVLFILWLYKSPEIGNMGALGNQIYLWSFVVMGIIVLFDKRIKLYFEGLEGKEAQRAIIDDRIAKLEADRNYIQGQTGNTPSREQRETLRRIDKEIRRLKGYFT